jgi:hypothetical protein
MSDLLAGELIKLRTTRTALGFGAAALLLVLAGVLVSILAGEPTTVEGKQGALAFGGAVGLVLLLLGAVGATGEFRHRTVAPSVLISPDRMRLVLARIGAYTLAGLVFGVVIAAVSLAIAIPLLGGLSGPDPSFGDYAEVIGGGLLAGALAPALGVGVGTLVRNQVVAVVGILVWLMIVESLVTVVSDKAADYSFGLALDSLAQGGDTEMSMGAAGLVVLAWTLVFCALGAIVDRRRDVE